MFKYILVPARGVETDAPVFRISLGLARLQAAHLAFLHAGLDVQKVTIPVASAEFGGAAGIAEIIDSLGQEATARHNRAKNASRTSVRAKRS